MKANVFNKVLLAAAVATASATTQAGIEVYNQDDTTVSFDASFNTFLSSTSIEREVDGVKVYDRDQARVRSGFLPNWFGASFSKKMGDITIGGRASFWVSINESNFSPTDSLVDTRQFYGTVDASWGQVLVGQDFTLFNRSNIFGDEILLGYGMTNDTLGLVDGGYVSFGNIGSGYIYPLPSSQITYRSPDMGGFKLAVGLVDPNRNAGSGPNGGDAEESAPRIEGELTFNTAIGEGGNLSLWGGFLQQTSEETAPNGEEVDSQGISYGAKVKFGGLTLHASGYDGEGLGFLTPADQFGVGIGGLNVFSENGEEVDSSGYLTQASFTMGSTRAVLSYGVSEIDNSDMWENETTTVALFHSFFPNLVGVLEYTMNEISYGGGAVFGPGQIVEEADAIAVGLVVNF